MDAIKSSSSIDAFQRRLRRDLRTTRWLRRIAVLLAIVITALILVFKFKY
jgi:hypothetical protein